jgi:hypothetical protein
MGRAEGKVSNYAIGDRIDRSVGVGDSAGLHFGHDGGYRVALNVDIVQRLVFIGGGHEVFI